LFYEKVVLKVDLKRLTRDNLSQAVRLSKLFWCGYCTTVGDLTAPTGFPI